MKSLGITVAIIAVPEHATYLKSLVMALSSQALEQDEVLLILSGFEDELAANISQLAPATTRIERTKLQSSGANRNLAFSLAKNEVVSFHDADDTYHPRRIEAVRHVFTTQSTVAFFHSFEVWSSKLTAEDWIPFDPTASGDPLRCISEDYFFEKTIVDPPRDRRREISYRTTGTDLVFNDPGTSFAITHGHASFLKALSPRFEYHERPEYQNEDGVFARDILQAGLPIRVSPLVLSRYRVGSTASPLVSIGSQFRRKLGQGLNRLFTPR